MCWYSTSPALSCSGAFGRTFRIWVSSVCLAPDMRRRPTLALLVALAAATATAATVRSKTALLEPLHFVRLPDDETGVSEADYEARVALTKAAPDLLAGESAVRALLGEVPTEHEVLCSLARTHAARSTSGALRKLRASGGKIHSFASPAARQEADEIVLQFAESLCTPMHLAAIRAKLKNKVVGVGTVTASGRAASPPKLPVLDPGHPCSTPRLGAKMSSVYPPAWMGGKQTVFDEKNLIDNLATTIASTAWPPTVGNWASVRVAHGTTIDRVMVYNRYDNSVPGDQTWLSPFEVYVGDSYGDTKVKCGPAAQQPGVMVTPAAPGPFTAYCNGVKGGYVTLKQVGAARLLSIAQMRVCSVPVPPPPHSPPPSPPPLTPEVEPTPEPTPESKPASKGPEPTPDAHTKEAAPDAKPKEPTAGGEHHSVPEPTPVPTPAPKSKQAMHSDRCTGEPPPWLFHAMSTRESTARIAREWHASRPTPLFSPHSLVLTRSSPLSPRRLLAPRVQTIPRTLTSGPALTGPAPTASAPPNTASTRRSSSSRALSRART